MPMVLINNKEDSINRKRRHLLKDKRGGKRRKRQPSTVRIDRNSYRATPNIQELEPQQLLTENDVFVDVENLDGDNIAHYFMTKDDTDPKLEGQSKSVVSFYHSDAFSELQYNSPRLSQEKICLIDDRTCQGSTSKALGVCEPLTVHEMFKKLQRKRFSITEPSIHRRLIFITDLNSHSLSALMATVPPSHVDALITFFHSHITLQPHIGIFAFPRGYPIITHSFGLPYYSWKSIQHSQLDSRYHADRKRLRKMHDLSFLSGNAMPPGQATDYVCEAQVSVMVTAINQTVWTGYCCVDTYHEPEERRQTVERYCKSDIQADEIQMDPFTNGACESDHPFLDPREYFLTVLECQTTNFKREWMDTKRMFRKRVESYIDGFQYAAGNSPASTPYDRQEPLNWLRQTRRMLTDLVSCLELTINCWDNYPFQGQFETEYAQRCLRSIQHNFLDLKKCLKELESIRTLCDNHKETLSLYSIETQNRTSQLQTEAAENAQTISYFLLYVLSPATIAAAMLSMQEKAIPTILGPTQVSFFILTPILALALYALSWVICSWEKVQKFFIHPLKPKDVFQPETIELEKIA